VRPPGDSARRAMVVRRADASGSAISCLSGAAALRDLVRVQDILLSRAPATADAATAARLPSDAAFALELQRVLQHEASKGVALPPFAVVEALTLAAAHDAGASADAPADPEALADLWVAALDAALAAAAAGLATDHTALELRRTVWRRLVLSER